MVHAYLQMIDAVTAAIAGASPEAVWAIFGSMATWLSWLSLQYVNKVLPMYNRLFGDDSDDTFDGHLVETDEQFDQIDDRHEELADEIESTKDVACEAHDKIDRMGDRQDMVFSSLQRIGDAVDAEVDDVPPWDQRTEYPQLDDD